jgi:hypothetical protein
VSSDHSSYGNVLTDEHVAAAETHIRVLLGDIAEQYRQFHKDGTWLFGDQVGPTLLDAYTVTAVSRLRDMERASLVPPELCLYADVITDGPEWKSVTHGRTTVYKKSYGPIHLLDTL